MPILTYLKLGVLAAVLAAGVYFYVTYRGMQHEIAEQSLQLAAAQTAVRDAETKLVATIEEHNAAFSKLTTEFYAERERVKLTERNYAEANDTIADLMAESQEAKAKYESGRLARLAAAKGGLITRLAATGAKRRNQDWQALAE
jgi:chromosome segregation ATPase